jgi:Arc/MetJ family transcription regulator
MRTTLDIDDDVLQAAKEIARREKKTAGKVVSMLARSALTAPHGTLPPREPRAVYGFRPFASRGSIVTNELIDAQREEDAY